MDTSLMNDPAGTVIGLSHLEKRLLKLSSSTPGTYSIYDPTEQQFVQPFKKSA